MIRRSKWLASIAALLVASALALLVRLHTSTENPLEIDLPDLQGENVNLDDLEGHVVLVYFFARGQHLDEQTRRLNRVQAELGPMGLEVIGVSEDGGPESAQQTVDRLHIAFSVVHDPDVLVHRYRIHTLPDLYVLDRSGRLRDVWHGPIPASEDSAFERELRSILAESR